MDTLTKDEIQKRFAELPPEVQRAVQSSEVQKHIQEVGAAHKLHVDQVGALEDETLLVMLGFSDPQEFGAVLSRNLGVSAAEGEAIARDIGEKVFLPIRGAMRKFMETNDERKATDNERLTTDEKLPTPTTNNERLTTNDGRGTTGDERRTTNEKLPTPTTNDKPAPDTRIAAMPRQAAHTATPAPPQKPALAQRPQPPALPSQSAGNLQKTQERLLMPATSVPEKIAVPPPAGRGGGQTKKPPVDPYREPID